MARNSRASKVKHEFRTNDELLEMLTRDEIRAKIKEMVRFIFSELSMPFGEDESLQLHVMLALDLNPTDRNNSSFANRVIEFLFQEIAHKFENDDLINECMDEAFNTVREEVDYWEPVKYLAL